MPELLLELLSEEIPAGYQERAAADLKRLIGDALTERSLTFDGADAFATPRRLAVVVRGLPDTQPDVRNERKGPRAGAPDSAIDGFLKSVGRTRDQVQERETPKGTFLFFDELTTGGPAEKVLPGVLAAAIAGLGWPKSMRWGDNQLRWVRPLHGLLALFDGKPLGLTLALGGGHLTATGATAGHRFMAPDPIQVSGFEEYRAKLRAAHVVLDGAERRDIIRDGAKALAAAEGLGLCEDDKLIAEIAGLVEWPVPLMGRIDEAFMALPPEVLATSMASHQRYLALETSEGALAPRFIVIANVVADDKGAAIVAGNERVLRARLADANFFWEQDRKTPLAARAPALSEIAFHRKLGSLDQKADRVQALAVEIAERVPGADKDQVHSAARLAKADLVSGMVGEFPGLQGIVGRYYALADGESEAVADAIRDQYSPKGPDDACPTAPVSVALGLAERIDTLVGFWAIGEKPTGSKDPFALRRAALGVIRLVVENELEMDLTFFLQNAYLLFRGDLDRDSGDFERYLGVNKLVVEKERYEEVKGWYVGAQLLDFFGARLAEHLRKKGMRHDIIRAVMPVSLEEDRPEYPGPVDLIRVIARADSLSEFLKTADGKNLLVAYRRAANIVRDEEKKDGRDYAGTPDPDRLIEPAEKDLKIALDKARDDGERKVLDRDFVGAMAALSKLRSPVDTFFEKVRVNAGDAELRENRLQLLALIRWSVWKVADFSKIEG